MRSHHPVPEADVTGRPLALPRHVRDLPGPGGLPLIGNALQLGGHDMHQVMERWSQEFGGVFQVRLGRKRVVVVGEGRLIHAILKDRPEGFRRYRQFEEIAGEMGIDGVFTAEGATWKRQRRITAQALANKHLREFFPTIQDVTRRLARRWLERSDLSQPIPISKDLMRFTVDLTTRLAFGYEMNTLEQERDLIQDHLELIFPKLHRRSFAMVKYWRWFKLPSDRQLDQALEEVRNLIQVYTDAARRRIAEQPELREAPTNFLESLLVAEEAGEPAFNDHEIQSNVFTMLLAGEDTTAHSIGWLVYHLMHHPKAQARLRQEIDMALDHEHFLTDYDQGNQLPYLEACIQESMRLKPVAVMILLEALQDQTLAGMHIPKGTNIFTLSRAESLDPHNFGQPEAFRPERWLQQIPGCPHAGARTQRPFGYGPRLCPGRNLATIEMKCVLVMLMRYFELTPPSIAPEVTERVAFAMNPEHLLVKFQRRS